MNIIKRNIEAKKVIVELSWYELDLFINEYDETAGRYLRQNDLEKAMYWSKLSKELEEIRKEVIGKE
jgi:hypothetical protein